MRQLPTLTTWLALLDEVTITSIIGRRHTGVLDCVNPSYSHSFGNTVPERLTIGTTHEPITVHGQEYHS